MSQPRYPAKSIVDRIDVMVVHSFNYWMGAGEITGLLAVHINGGKKNGK